MDKRLAKRHKRAVTRAKERVRISEPDVRTHEEIEAARTASQSGNVKSDSGPAMKGNSGPRVGGPATGTGSAPKTSI